MRRKRSQNDSSGGGEGNWMNTYGDLVTLLLTFFVLLYSFSSVDAAKWESLVMSFSGSSGIFQSNKQGGNKDLPASTDFNPNYQAGDPVLDDGELDYLDDYNQPTMTSTEPTETAAGVIVTPEPTPTLTPTPKPTAKPTPKPTKAPTKAPTAAPTTVDPGIKQLYNELQQYLSGTSLSAAGLQITSQNSEIMIRLVASVIFEPGSDTLRPDSLKAIQGASEIINKYLPQIRSMRTEGHTDSITPPEGDISSKWELAARRAAIVLNKVIERCAIDPGKAYTVAYGSTRPIASDATSEGQDQNNRVDIILIH